MTAEQEIKARVQAELDLEPLIKVLRQTLIECYVEGFFKGLQWKEENDQEPLQQNNKEEVPQEEPLVRLKPNAILKRRLRPDEFPTRVWNTFVDLNIKTLGDILDCSEMFYLGRSKFGMGSLNAIKKYVESFGYKLRKK